MDPAAKDSRDEFNNPLEESDSKIQESQTYSDIVKIKEQDSDSSNSNPHSLMSECLSKVPLCSSNNTTLIEPHSSTNSATTSKDVLHKSSKKSSKAIEMQLYMEKLKEMVPYAKNVQNMSKVQLIHCAIDYITDLQESLEARVKRKDSLNALNHPDRSPLAALSATKQHNADNIETSTNLNQIPSTSSTNYPLIDPAPNAPHGDETTNDQTNLQTKLITREYNERRILTDDMMKRYLASSSCPIGGKLEETKIKLGKGEKRKHQMVDDTSTEEETSKSPEELEDSKYKKKKTS